MRFLISSTTLLKALATMAGSLNCEERKGNAHGRRSTGAGRCAEGEDHDRGDGVEVW